MKTLFDSSIVIAFCVKNHPKHEMAKQWFLKAQSGKISMFLAAHSLIEAYSVMTRAPFKPKISAEKAKELLHKNVLPLCTIIGLEVDAYKNVLDLLADNNLVGGISYDAIIFETAQQANIKQLITANTKDFYRLNTVFDYDIDVIGI